MDENHASMPFGLAPATLRLLTALACIGMLAAVFFSVFGVQSLPGMHGTSAGDFDIFYTVAQLAQQGRIEDAYNVETLVAAQAEMGREVHRMTWTYPPPFDLLLMPLAYVSQTAAYLIFSLLSLGALLFGIRKLSGAYFGPVLLASLPAILVSLRTGQNGTLTAALIALGCVFVLHNRQKMAGVAFGALIIKPHLGVGVGLWCLFRWQPVIVAAAVFTALLFSVVSIAVLGPSAWEVFLTSATDTGDRLGGAEYPAFRMGSLFATLASLGISPSTALLAHASATIAALAGLALAAKALEPRVGLASAILLTPLFSPYIYDYDLALFAPAMALLLPELDRLGRRGFVLPIIVLVWIAGGTGFAQNMRGAAVGAVDGITLAGFATVALAGLVLAIGLLSGRRDQPSSASIMPTRVA